MIKKIIRVGHEHYILATSTLADTRTRVLKHGKWHESAQENAHNPEKSRQAWSSDISQHLSKSDLKENQEVNEKLWRN